MKLLNLLIILLLIGCSSDKQESDSVADNSAVYKVSFGPDKKTVSVEAEFTLENEIIYTYVQSIPELPDGEASFFKNVMLRDKVTGKQIEIKSMKEGDWVTAGKNNERVILSYNIEMDHEKYSWPSGIDEVAFVREDGIFFTGDALFIIPGEQIKNIMVEFSLPEGWKVSTPWKEKTKNKFEVTGYRDLISNCLFAGTHLEENILIDQFNLKIVLGGNQKKSKDLLVGVMTPVLKNYMKLFGDNTASTYLIVVHEDKMNDGGAYKNSFSQLVDGEVNELSKVTWAHTMAHEIFHLWNGNSIIPEGQEEWFKEGFTDYMTVVYLSRLNILDRNNILKTIENIYRKYVLSDLMRDPATDRISIRSSGDNKAKNRLLVYGGGELIAMMLDIEIREKSGGKNSVDTLMKRMFTQFGKTGKHYSLNDIILLSSELAGSDMKWFFDKYVTGTDKIDMRPYFKKLGLQLDTFVEEININQKEDASESEKTLFKSIYEMN